MPDGKHTLTFETDSVALQKMGPKICIEPQGKICFTTFEREGLFFKINSGYSKRLEREKPMSLLSFWTKTPQVQGGHEEGSFWSKT